MLTFAHRIVIPDHLYLDSRVSIVDSSTHAQRLRYACSPPLCRWRYGTCRSTATSLARLWQSQDKRQEAYDLLAPVYGWFTEGFDTEDLQEAKAFLSELE